MRHLAVPHHLAHHRADGSALLRHGHVVDVVVEHGQQPTHHVKTPCRRTPLSVRLSTPDAGTQGGILTIQFLDALFQVDSSGAVAEVNKESIRQLIFRCVSACSLRRWKACFKLGAVTCVGGLCLFQLLHKVAGMVGKRA